MTRRSARRTGSGRHPVRSFRSFSICASHPVLRASMSPWSAGRRARGRSDCWRLRRAAPTAPYPGASIAAPVELILAVQGADQAAEPPQKPWEVCISPREVTNPNSRPNATHESASPESHSPETGDGGGTADIVQRTGVYVGRARARGFVVVVSQRGWWDFGAAETERASQRASSGRPVAGRAARDLPGGSRGRRCGERILRVIQTRVLSLGHFRPSVCRYSDGRALVAHSENLSSVARPSGGELT